MKKDITKKIEKGNQQALQYFKQGEIEKAIELLNSVLNGLTPKFIPENEDIQGFRLQLCSAFYSRGFCYEELNDFEKAIADYNQSAEIGQMYGGDIAAAKIANIYCYKLQDYEKAIAYTKERVKKYFFSDRLARFMGYKILGCAYLNTGDREQSIFQYEEIYKSFPEEKIIKETIRELKDEIIAKGNKHKAIAEEILTWFKENTDCMERDNFIADRRKKGKDKFVVMKAGIPTGLRKNYRIKTSELEPAIERCWELNQGISRIKDWPSEIGCKMDNECFRVKQLADVLSGYGQLLISVKLKELLEKNALHNQIEFLPIKIINFKGKVFSENYFILNPLDIFDAMDKQASGSTWNTIDSTMISCCEKLILKESAIPEGSHLFRLKNFLSHILISRDLADKIKAEKITGVYFRDTYDFTGI